MRKILLAVLSLLLVSASVAMATPVWTSTGWYVVADTIVGPFVWSGPYADEQACTSNKPANEEDADYFCEYLTERPSWDE